MVLDSSQILHGKLERADDALVRDVFDLIKAAEHDPRALAAAVNCRSLHDTEVTALTLENADATLERDARTQLVGAGEIDDPATLGTQAGAALRGAVYRHVAIWTERERAIVECRTYSGGIHRTAIAPGEIDRRLRRERHRPPPPRQCLRCEAHPPSTSRRLPNRRRPPEGMGNRNGSARRNRQATRAHTRTGPLTERSTFKVCVARIRTSEDSYWVSGKSEQRGFRK